MTTRVPNISTLKSPKSIVIKKTLIIVAAASGLIAAGAFAYASVQSAAIALDEEGTAE